MKIFKFKKFFYKSYKGILRFQAINKRIDSEFKLNILVKNKNYKYYLRKIKELM